LRIVAGVGKGKSRFFVHHPRTYPIELNAL
jgi:hypothetical protein